MKLACRCAFSTEACLQDRCCQPALLATEQSLCNTYVQWQGIAAIVHRLNSLQCSPAAASSNCMHHSQTPTQGRPLDPGLTQLFRMRRGQPSLLAGSSLVGMPFALLTKLLQQLQHYLYQCWPFHLHCYEIFFVPRCPPAPVYINSPRQYPAVFSGYASNF